MKKAFILFVVLLATVSFAEKGDMKVGPHVGLWLPIGDPGDVYNLSPRFGAKFLYGLNENMDIEGNVAYGLMQPKEDWDGWSSSILEIAGGVRYHFKDNMYAGGGLGINMVSVEYDWGYGTTYDASDSELGLFGCFGMKFPQKSFEIDPEVKLHLIDGDIWFTLDVGFNFPIGGK